MTTEEMDFNKICRVCCSEGVMMSLFKVQMSKKLMACASIQVWQNDGLPPQICNKCAAKLHIAFQFKKLCERSDARLRQYIINPQAMSQIQHQQQQQQPQQQQQTAPPQQNQGCVYVECTPALDNLSEPKYYENLQTVSSQLYAQSNSLQPLQSYSIQGLHVPSVQFPVSSAQYNTVHPNGHILIGQLPVSSAGQVVTLNNAPVQSVAQMPDNIMKNTSTNSMRMIKRKPLQGVIRSTNENDGFKCSICFKEFSSASKLTRHVKTHSGEMPYKCKVCHKAFSHSGNFKVHMRMHTDERPFVCSVCDKACRQAQDLEKHMRTHTGEKPHVCPVCQRAFSTSSNLIAHGRIHTGEKPYVCSVCQKAFCQSNELTKHVRTHTGEKSHACTICHKGFNGSSTLIVHMRSHTGERPYICSICNKGFTQSSCLAVHIKRHTGEKNFHCETCSRSFVTNADLKEHMLTHSSDKPFGCNMCNKRYSRANDLNRHTKTHAL
ncbi:zinc finger protein 2-like [Ctenocephalides felis]|uniref:zinc finger protein 2-like n=1 Tax=Ctenocephalides felis TaxID=7515 RepID=UPI000E6E20EF|nr:zinc finger protein 2-like [Ctenocephalides felis]